MRHARQAVRVALLAVMLGATLPAAAAAQRRGPDCSPRPYGDYCDGPRWGRYGARRTVATVEEAGKILREYYRDQPVKVGKIVKRRRFFEAEILDANGKVVDRVIVHPRTGRIRSIY